MTGQNNYIFALLAGAMNGKDFIRVEQPFMMIPAKSMAEAEEKYRKEVPLATYFPAHLVAVKIGTVWRKESEFVNTTELIRIIDGLIR